MFKVMLVKSPSMPELEWQAGIVIDRKESQGDIYWYVDFGGDQQHWVKPCHLRILYAVEPVTAVRQVETGRIFKNISEAAKQMQVGRAAIYTAIKRKGAIGWVSVGDDRGGDRGLRMGDRLLINRSTSSV